MSLSEELRAFLEGQNVLLPAKLDGDTPLISSGHLDSLAVMNLAMRIEERTTRPLDLSTVDTWDMRMLYSMVG